jgi:diphthamide biosynthesis protein 3
MAAVYDEVEIEDMTWDAARASFSYPCPCGDKFGIPLGDLEGGEDIARCPSCSLLLRVVFDGDVLDKFRAEADAAAAAGVPASTAVETR